MADEPLAEAFERLGVRPLPSVEGLQTMTEDERREAHRMSMVSADQYEQLPPWYREKVERHAAETMARRDVEQAGARLVS